MISHEKTSATFEGTPQHDQHGGTGHPENIWTWCIWRHPIFGQSHVDSRWTFRVNVQGVNICKYEVVCSIRYTDLLAYGFWVHSFRYLHDLHASRLIIRSWCVHRWIDTDTHTHTHILLRQWQHFRLCQFRFDWWVLLDPITLLYTITVPNEQRKKTLSEGNLHGDETKRKRKPIVRC